jgi:hypothetical protein
VLVIEAPIVPEMGEGALPRVPEQGNFEYVPEQAAPAVIVSEQAAVQLTSSEHANVEAVTPPIDSNWQQALDLSAMQERYPLLRNAL